MSSNTYNGELMLEGTAGGDSLTLEKLHAMIEMVAGPPLPRIFESIHLTILKQIRFPRSKKRRIRKKWAKRPDNFVSEPAAYWVGGDLYAHPVIVRKMREQTSMAVKEFEARRERDMLGLSVFKHIIPGGMFLGSLELGVI